MMAQQHNFNGGKQMDKNTILNYVTETPGNTNRAVLGSMLDSMGGSGTTQSQIVVKLLEQVDNFGFSTDKSFSEVVEFINNGIYNIILVPEAYSTAAGKVFILSTINTGDSATGGVGRLVFASIDATGSAVSVSSLAWLPSNSNMVSGQTLYIS